MKQNPASSSEALSVPFDRVATFIRQVTHDVRNDLNSMDLQAAYSLELTTDPEVAEEVRRIRTLVQHSAKQLQALSANFWTAQPSFIDYSARIFVEDLRDRLTKTFPEQMGAVEWNIELGEEEKIEIDIEMIFSAMAELFRNAFQFREAGQKIAVRAYGEGKNFVFELNETKSSVPSDPSEWGKEPFLSTKRGGYGLGLFRVRRILALHGGELAFFYESGRTLLTSRIMLKFV